MRRLDTFFDSLADWGEVYRASVFVPGWFMYSHQNVTFCDLDAFARTDTYRALLASRNKVAWMPTESIMEKDGATAPVLSLYRKIRHRTQLNDLIGVIRVSILESDVRRVLSNAEITQGSNVFLINEANVFICGSGQEVFAALLEDAGTGGALRQGGLDWAPAQGGALALTAQGIPNTDWVMVSAVPFREIYAQSHQIRGIILVIAGVVGAVACAMAYVLSAVSLRGVMELTEKMRRVQEGDLNAEVFIPRARDEISEMMRTFNFMLKRIRQLAEEQYNTGREAENAKLIALQSQINPHFLYNTLDLINWKALEHGIKEITPIVKALARFYKLSHSKGEDEVTLAEELEHLRVYVRIQNMRFDDSIHLSVQVERALHTSRIPKLILQPLVENAIVHGILGRRGGHGGVIAVTGQGEGKDAVLTITDDGIGMSREKCASILRRGASGGYGVYNTDQRLKLRYGPAYGLGYTLPPEGGVRVEIRFPVNSRGG
jgi:two-component system sensor histidine kinase YesM